MRRDVLWPSKDIYHVDFYRHINQLSIDFFTENFRDLGIIDRHGKDLEPGGVHVLWDIESRLISLRFSLNAEHRDRFRLRKQFAKLVRVCEDVVAPVGIHEPRLTRVDADDQIGRGLTRIHADPKGTKRNHLQPYSLFDSDPRLSA